MMFLKTSKYLISAGVNSKLLSIKDTNYNKLFACNVDDLNKILKIPFIFNQRYSDNECQQFLATLARFDDNTICTILNKMRKLMVFL